MNCTVTMPNDLASELRSVNWKELHRANYQFAAPFIVALDDGELTVQQIIRLIPKRRMVVFGLWKGQPVVAKLFYDRDALRHANEDSVGVKVLVERNIPTPALLCQSKTADRKIQALIFDRIQKGVDLEKIWQTRESNESVLDTLHGVMVELATQHVLGVKQNDMHMGNFLIDGKTIYTLDGAEVDAQNEILSIESSMNNLALFLSQLGSGVDALQEHLFLYYAKLRGWLLKPQDRTSMKLQIKKWNESRWQKYEKKIFRNSTDFTAIKRFAIQGMVRRDFAGNELMDFVQHPDAVFSRPDAVMMKNGRSSTVININLDGRELVIKRYNLKNFWHRLRRAMRVTRARKSWRLAQKLNLFYVNTAKPVAYVESNLLGLRGKSYFVTERVRGDDIKKHLQQFEAQPETAMDVVRRVVAMLRSLARLEVTHGDLKASNIILNENLQPVLIDLDGAAEHASAAGLRKAWNAEVQRFMKNFDDLPALHAMIRQAWRNE